VTIKLPLLHGAETAIVESRPPRTSELLILFAQSVHHETVSIRQVVDALGDRGLGVLIAVFALPNVLPTFIPFSNILFGLLVMIFGLHLMLGVRHLVLPKGIGRRAIGANQFKAWAPRLAVGLAQFERFLKPSLPALTLAAPERVIGLVTILFAFVSALPLPFMHNLPAAGLVLIGLGLIERDGRAILAGIAIGTVGVAILIVVLLSVAAGFGYFSQFI
jgi:hypothetical protein